MGQPIKKAIWSVNDYDIEVYVIRYLGTQGGERYYLVRTNDGETGVPASQLRLLPQQLSFNERMKKFQTRWNKVWNRR